MDWILGADGETRPAFWWRQLQAGDIPENATQIKFLGVSHEALNRHHFHFPRRSVPVVKVNGS